MNWYLKVFRNYATFKGRADRAEFWWFTLIHLTMLLTVALIDEVLGFGFNLSVVYFLFGIIPSLAVSVRRLHDINCSASWLLVGLIPILGKLILLWCFVQYGQRGDNQYGPNPRGTLLSEDDIACFNCGTPFNPEDHRNEFEDRVCPECGAPLPDRFFTTHP